MELNKHIKKIYCSNLGNYILEILIIFVVYFILVDKFSFSNIKFDLNLGLAICIGRMLTILTKVYFIQKYCRKYTLTEKFMSIGTFLILFFFVFFISNYESTRQETIQTHIKNININELKIDISKAYVEDREEDRWLHQWQIIIKDKIEFINIETKKTHVFALTNKEKESFLKTIKEIKTIDSTWNKEYYGQNTWLIEIATNKNYLAFTKAMMKIEIEDEKKQKTVLKLLKYIDNKLKPLTDTTTLNTNHSRKNQ